MNTAAVIEEVARPLDRVRVAIIRALGPLGRQVVARRDLRVGLNGVLGIAVSLFLATCLPLWTLALAPIGLGVPHLVADVRYLVLRPGLHRRRALWGAWLAPIVGMALGASVAVGLAAAVGSAIAGEGSTKRRILVGTGATAVTALAALTEPWASLVVAHAHNLVAVALWWAWRGRSKAWHYLPIMAFVLGYGAILGGAFDGAALAVGVPPGLPMGAWREWLAPGFGEWGARLVVAFAFAQGVHYGVWLRLVPDEDRARESSRTVRRTFAELLADCGGWLLLIAAGALLVFIGWAMRDLAGARDGYLAFARFHGSLEFAVAALWMVEGRPRP